MFFFLFKFWLRPVSEYSKSALDCEQPLFFFRFSKGSTRARECWAAKPRDARNEGGSPRRKKRDSLLSCLSRLAPSVTRVVICVFRANFSTDQAKRETARSLRAPWISNLTKFKSDSPIASKDIAPQSLEILLTLDFTFATWKGLLTPRLSDSEFTISKIWLWRSFKHLHVLGTILGVADQKTCESTLTFPAGVWTELQVIVQSHCLCPAENHRWSHCRPEIEPSLPAFQRYACV